MQSLYHYEVKIILDMSEHIYFNKNELSWRIFTNSS